MLIVALTALLLSFAATGCYVHRPYDPCYNNRYRKEYKLGTNITATGIMMVIATSTITATAGINGCTDYLSIRPVPSSRRSQGEPSGRQKWYGCGK